MFAFLASSSFIFIEVLGLERTPLRAVLFSTGVAYFAGTFLCRGTHGPLRPHAHGGHWRAAQRQRRRPGHGGGRAGWHTPLALLPPFYLFMLGHGIHQPCGQSGCVAPFPDAAGVASAFNGFMMMLVAFATGAWVSAAAQRRRSGHWCRAWGCCSVLLA